MQILGEHESSVKKMLDEFGVYLKPSTFGKDVKPFLKDACSQIFGSATGLVDMMIAHVPSSKAGNANKVCITAASLCCLVPHSGKKRCVPEKELEPETCLACSVSVHHIQ